MNLQYLKSQFIPKSKTLKIIYGILWVLEPWIMCMIIGYKIYKDRKVKEHQMELTQYG